MKTNNFNYSLLVIFCFLQLNDILSQNIDSLKTYELEPIIFSATKTERQLSSIPLSATIIQKNDYGPIKKINDILVYLLLE